MVAATASSAPAAVASFLLMGCSRFGGAHAASVHFAACGFPDVEDAVLPARRDVSCGGGSPRSRRAVRVRRRGRLVSRRPVSFSRLVPGSGGMAPHRPRDARDPVRATVVRTAVTATEERLEPCDG
ncbi:hypothetical protein GCM10010273_22410 [Streptomyces lavendulocolor]